MSTSPIAFGFWGSSSSESSSGGGGRAEEKESTIGLREGGKTSQQEKCTHKVPQLEEAELGWQLQTMEKQEEERKGEIGGVRRESG